PDRGAARGPPAVRPAHRGRAADLQRAAAGHGPAGGGGAGTGAAGGAGAGRRRRDPGGRLLPRDAQEDRPGRRPAARPPGAVPGRAVRGHRPGVGPDHPRPAGALHRRRGHGGLLQPRHGAGGAALRPGRDHAPGPPHRRGADRPGAGRAQPRGRLRGAGRGGPRRRRGAGLAGHLVGLKLALLRNGLRRSNSPQQVGLALGALAGLPLAFGGFLLLALVPRAEPAAGLILVEVVFLLVFCGWGLFPLLSFAGDASLDPSRLALLPLRPGQLVGGLSLAACVGVAPLCTLVALGGAVVGFATLGPGMVLVVAAVLVQFALCIVGSRALLTALSHQLRSRRARDLVIVLVSVIALGFNLALQVGARLAERLERSDLEALRPLARALGWLPPGLAARALVHGGQGRLLAATAELAGAALAVVLLRGGGPVGAERWG